MPPKPCKRTEVYDPVERRCVKRDRKNKRQTVILSNRRTLDSVERQVREARRKAKAEARRIAREEAAKKRKRDALRARFRKWAESIPKKWKKRPGQPGFNAYAYSQMIQDGLPANLQLACPLKGQEPRPMAYQSTVAYLVRPNTNIERLLVIARTGAGKTYTMIQVLDNYFNDTRPKIVIFPNGAVANNFYSEILFFPSKYRDFIRQKLGKDPSLDKVASLLKNRRSGLASPIISFSYARAGGNTFLKTLKTYSNSIICMDEFHNLVAPTKEMNRYTKQLTQLKTGLKTAKDSIVLGFTATPFVNSKEEGEQLLSIVKGDNRGNDEGFVTYFNAMPPAQYPMVFPGENQLGYILSVDPSEDTEKAYAKKLKQLNKAAGNNCTSENMNKVKCQTLQNYANMDKFYAQYKRGDPNFVTRFQKSLDSESNIAPKFKLLLEMLKRNQRKSLVLVERNAGFKAVADIIKEGNLCSNCVGSIYEKKASKSILKTFNSPDNLTGSKMRYMVADAKEFSEGVSFFAVRDFYLLNPPLYFGRYLQQIGRVLRSCKHNDLAKDQRTVNIYIMVTKGTIDETALSMLEKEEKEYARDMARFEKIAVDARVLKEFFAKMN